MRATAILVSSVLLVAPLSPARASPDCDAVRCAERDALEGVCPCRDAVTHGQYVRCVAETVGDLAQQDRIPPECKAALKRCAARSVCGKRSGVVVCDLPTRCPAGTCSRCKLVPSAERCLARGGAVAARTSCCSECTPVVLVPCGPTLTCDGATEICVSRQPFGPAVGYECEPVPVGCELDRTCACAGPSLCQAPFDGCSDAGADAIDCLCPLCQ